MRLSRGQILVFLIVALALGSVVPSYAQFRDPAFSQQYNNDPATAADSTEKLFSFKEYFGGLGHKNELKVGTLFAGSAVFIGGNQIYNKQYWKLPIIYAGIGTGLGLGFHYRSQGNSTAAALSFAGAGLVWWGSMMDGVICYKPDDYPSAGKATLYSLLVPGLGQVYNKEYWKVPLYWGMMAAGLHFYSDFSKNFQRFRGIYIDATDSAGTYDGPITADQALYYRNIYRRYRDYALLATRAVYVLQIVDADVFAYMHNFEVNDDISMSLSPTVIMPQFQMASNTLSSPAAGLRIGFSF